jgi:hypothetical protein
MTADGRPANGSVPIAGDLRVGTSGRFQGIYYLHWEWTRFEFTVTVPARNWRWRRRRLVRCELVPEPAPLPDVIEQAARPVGRGPGARFAVTVDADIIDHGSFGHRGTLRWRLAVQRWVTVQPIP